MQNNNFKARDHPRRCGENIYAERMTPAQAGSPPQVRGKPDSDHRPRQGTGITPAGAGKTPMLQASLPAKQDHPRRCGENFYVGYKIKAQAGSPPQVRGKQKVDRIEKGDIRITPAGAGKTWVVHLFEFNPWDHPRRCGENRSGRYLSLLILGSPPQVRGKP